MTLKRSSVFLILLLLFIILDEALNNTVIGVFAKGKGISSFVWPLIFLGLQIIAAPIQAGYSDFYCRKKSLYVSLFVSLMSLVLVVWFNCFSQIILLLILLLKGGLGNTLPLALAGLSDVSVKNFRFSLGLATSSMAMGYILLSGTNHLFGEDSSRLIIIALFIIALFLCYKFFKDPKDLLKKKRRNLEVWKQKFSLMKEISSMWRDFILNKRFRRALFAFLMWEYSFYVIALLEVDLSIEFFKLISLVMPSGYLLGVFILNFLKNKNHDVINWGYKIAIISLLCFFISTYIFGHSKTALALCYFFYSVGFAFMIPGLFAMLSQEHGNHEQGKIYGLIDSFDTIALLFAMLTGKAYKVLKIYTSPSQIIIVSFLALLLGTYLYIIFQRTKKTLA